MYRSWTCAVEGVQGVQRRELGQGPVPLETSAGEAAERSFSEQLQSGRNQGSMSFSRDHCPISGVQFLTSVPEHVLAVLLVPWKTYSAHLILT